MKITKQRPYRVKIIWGTKLLHFGNRLAYHAYQKDGSLFINYTENGLWR